MKHFTVIALDILLLILLVSAPACTHPGQVASGIDAPVTKPVVDHKISDVPSSSIWIAPAVPDGLRTAIHAAGWVATDTRAAGEIALDLSSDADQPSSTWIYALVAAFPTVTDGVSLGDLKSTWNGISGRSLVMSASTFAAMKSVLGAAGGTAVRVVSPDSLAQTLWKERAAWGIVPFEALDPRLKVLALDGESPIDKDFEPLAYALKVGFSLTSPAISLPATNRDPSKLTTVLMTGTTALTRATAYKMEQFGVYYPARDIHDWLTSADILHISSEVSFAADCPPPNPDTHKLIFCSAPENIQLFDGIGVDVIELTGNHMNDWGTTDFQNTIDLYRQHGFGLFGGGSNLEQAMQPLLLQKNGTKFAFIGCNVPGPVQVLATPTSPGAAPCGNYEWMTGEISTLKSQGYQVIATLQYNEYYLPKAPANQVQDFTRLADAGATIVNGSQAHFPQSMAFDGSSFIHYGPGNLFFDQMDTPVVGTRREFLDRHVFYDGRYISTELLTAMLEDYARPRPMTLEERQQFLQEYFIYSGW